ncbi:hypothetical protein E4U53_005913 [Claviceps sorghi]|nr:hypothetical protein E4U53_005913 [Claviceps sorghi]
MWKYLRAASDYLLDPRILTWVERVRHDWFRITLCLRHRVMDNERWTVAADETNPTKQSAVEKSDAAPSVDTQSRSMRYFASEKDGRSVLLAMGLSTQNQPGS